MLVLIGAGGGVLVIVVNGLGRLYWALLGAPGAGDARMGDAIFLLVSV